MSTTLQPLVAGASAAAAAAPTPPKASSTSDPLANQQMFLQLLVQQLKNQDPESPSDPKDFIAQLSQMSGVEQMVGMRTELEAIHALLTPPTTSTPTPTVAATQK